MAPIANLAVKLSASAAEFSSAFTTATAKLDKFTKDADDSATRLETAVSRMGGTFSNIANNAAGVAAGMLTASAAIGVFNSVISLGERVIAGTVGAIKDAVTHTSTLGDSLFTLSQKTGVSVESLSALKFVASQTNTSIDTIAGAVFKLEANLGKITSGSSAAKAIGDLGLSLKTLKTQDPAAAFADILSKLGDLPTASARASAGVALFGKSFQGIAQLSQENLPALIAQAQKLGLVMSTETAVAADRFNDAMGVLRGGLEGVQLQIGAKLLPAVIAFAEGMGEAWRATVEGAGISASQFGQAFDTLVQQTATAAAKMIQIFALLVDAAVQWSTDSVLAFGGVIQAQISFANTAIKVARVMDSVAGGNLATVFDQMAANVKEAQNTLDALVKPILIAGSGLRTLAGLVEQTAAKAGENFAKTYQRIQSEIAKTADTMRSKLTPGVDATGESAKRVTQAFRNWLPELAANERALDSFGKKTSDVLGMIEKGLLARRTATLGPGADDKWLKDQIELARLQASLSVGGIGGGLGGMMTGLTPGKLASMMTITPQAAEQATNPFRDAFGQLGRDLPGIVFGALQGGGSVVGAVGAAVGAQFGKTFQDALTKAGGDLSKVSGGNKVLGIAGASIGAAVTGYDLGKQLGKGKGAAAGAASGALAGSVAGPWGTAIGAGVGAIAGYFGGRSADKKAKQAMEENRVALLKQFGGMEKLNALANKLGVSMSAAFDTKKPAVFNAAVEKLNAAIEAQNTRVAALGSALEGVNARATTFGAKFQGLLEAKNAGGDAGAAAAAVKLMEAAATSQPEFERLGLLVSGVFGGMVKESGNAFDAIKQLAPSFQVLQAGISDFGLTSTGVIDTLLKNFELVNSEAFGPLLENVQNTGQVLKGLFDAKSLSPEVFQAAAADIGQSLQELANRGGDISAALALSQPVLQTLWESQQTFGSITDQTTLSILDQAEAQGLVGAQMKSVNDKILDVLLAIGKVLGADLPAAFERLRAPAENAAKGIQDAFSGVDIRIPIRFDQEQFDLSGVPALAGGGIVRSPTLALIAERGPEAVIPLGREGLGMGDQTITVYNVMDGEVMTRNVLKRAPGVFRDLGL